MYAVDLSDVAALPALLDAVEAALGGIDVLLVACGVLPDQAACEASMEETRRAVDVNFRSAVALLSGLRARLNRSGVAVVTIAPGFVDTPMTAHLPKSPLLASAKSVGAGVVKAIAERQDVVYLPGWWRLVMLGVRHLPEGVFKKLRF